MKRILCLLLVILWAVTTFPMVGMAETETVTAMGSGYQNVLFSNGYRGFCLDRDLHGAEVDGAFTTTTTEMAFSNYDSRVIAQELKVLFTQNFESIFVSDGNGGYVVRDTNTVQGVVWHLTENQYVWGEQKTLVEAVKEYDGPEIPDDGYKRTLANGDVITFSFLVIQPDQQGVQDFFGYSFTVSRGDIGGDDEPDEPTGGDDPDEPDEPTGGDDPDEPDEPTGGDDPDEPTGGDDPDEPDEPTGGDEPDDPDEPDEPTGGDEPDEPTGGDEPDEPTGGDEPDEPTGGDEPDEPDEPTGGDVPDEPTGGDESNDPADGEENDPPTGSEDPERPSNEEDDLPPSDGDDLPPREEQPDLPFNPPAYDTGDGFDVVTCAALCLLALGVVVTLATRRTGNET